MLNKELSIIIVNFRSEQFLQKCLTSIYNKINSKISFEIIIINNDLKEKMDLISKNYPDIKIINQDKNIGFGSGNNVGAKSASGDWLLFLNPDTEIISENIENVLAKFSQSYDVGVIGCGLITLKGKKQKWSAGEDMNLFNLFLSKVGFSKNKKIWQSEKMIRVDWVSGAAFFIRKKLWSELGGFNEKFFMYFEDMDLCKRVRKTGKNVLYYPQFKVLHRSGGSYEKKEKQKKDYYISQDYYFEKYYGKVQAKIVRVLRNFLKI